MTLAKFITKKQKMHSVHAETRHILTRKLEFLQARLNDEKLKPADRKAEETNLAQCKKELAEVTKKCDDCHNGDPNGLVNAYLDTLPVTAKVIDLAPVWYGSIYSITEIPAKLARFTCLEKLVLSGNERLSNNGVENIPPSVKVLECYHTDFENVDFLLRLPNLVAVRLDKNRRLRDLPDLSGLAHLEELHICDIDAFQHRRLPTLPTTLRRLACPANKRYFTSSETCITEYKNKINRQKMTSCYFNVKQPDNVLVFAESPRSFLEHVKLVNQILPVLEELPEASAKLCMHPNRIMRLIESGELDLCEPGCMDI